MNGSVNSQGGFKAELVGEITQVNKGNGYLECKGQEVQPNNEVFKLFKHYDNANFTLRQNLGDTVTNMGISDIIYDINTNSYYYLGYKKNHTSVIYSSNNLSTYIQRFVYDRYYGNLYRHKHKSCIYKNEIVFTIDNINDEIILCFSKDGINWNAVNAAKDVSIMTNVHPYLFTIRDELYVIFGYNGNLLLKTNNKITYILHTVEGVNNFSDFVLINDKLVMLGYSNLTTQVYVTKYVTHIKQLDLSTLTTMTIANGFNPYGTANYQSTGLCASLFLIDDYIAFTSPYTLTNYTSDNRMGVQYCELDKYENINNWKYSYIEYNNRYVSDGYAFSATAGDNIIYCAYSRIGGCVTFNFNKGILSNLKEFTPQNYDSCYIFNTTPAIILSTWSDDTTRPSELYSNNASATLPYYNNSAYIRVKSAVGGGQLKHKISVHIFLQRGGRYERKIKFK